ncbi:hypothetical protein ACFP81_03740 [Deinococcus lacus]|uniref:Uncharacterized protein n=1 Tax=Deinococcus lacus TaxID=392561 RepID=A0ABW1YDB0_9DEIO
MPSCGCLGCGGLLAALLAAVLGWFIFVAPVIGALTGSLGDTVTTQTQTQPPPQSPAEAPERSPGAALSRAEVEAFVRIRRDIRRALGDSFAQLEPVWAQVQAGQNPDLMTAVRVVRELGSGVQDARRAHLAGLEREGMTLERYGEVRGTVNRALGIPEVDFAGALGELGRAQGEQRIPDIASRVKVASPAEKALIAPFSRELSVTAPVSLLGL